MADSLFELLAPHLEGTGIAAAAQDTHTTNYLTRLTTLSLSELTFTEPASLQASAQSHTRAIQALSKRSHKPIISSSTHIEKLSGLLPTLSKKAHELEHGVPELESSANAFARKYDKNAENAVLAKRKEAMLLLRNVDRVSDILDLPSLLSSTVSAAQASSSGASTSASSTSFASALDIHAHIKRLNALYPQSELVKNVSQRSENEMQNLASILVTSLQNPALKLAAAIRTVGLLRRVAPELTEDGSYGVERSGDLSTRTASFSAAPSSHDGALGALFLICRLKTLHNTLQALDPLRELADQESKQKQNINGVNGTTAQKSTSSALGTQSERFLKRYIDIFREQSFAILSMYKGIFPSNLPTPDDSNHDESHDQISLSTSEQTSTSSLPSPLASFSLHLVDLLTATLHTYLPNVTDSSARESLLTQVLYCAGSLGRLGAEFGMMVALLADAAESDSSEAEIVQQDTALGDPEWVQVMKKHRVQASRLEVLARGVGTGTRKTSAMVQVGSESSVVSAAAV